MFVYRPVEHEQTPPAASVSSACGISKGVSEWWGPARSHSCSCSPWSGRNQPRSGSGRSDARISLHVSELTPVSSRFVRSGKGPE